MSYYTGKEKALEGLISYVDSCQWYLERGIMSVVKDSFGYLGIDREQLNTLGSFVSTALSSLDFGFSIYDPSNDSDEEDDYHESADETKTYYISGGYSYEDQQTVIGIVKDAFEMIEKHLIGDSMLRLGRGKPNMKRWHDSLVSNIPDFFELRSKRENPEKYITYEPQLKAYKFASAIEKDVARIPVLIVQPENLRKHHTYIIGLSGKGKTTLIWDMIVQDMKMGAGLGLIAPDTDIFERKILPHVPDNRMDDVIYINPSDPKSKVSLNPFFLGPNDNLDVKANEIFTVFQRVLGAGTTPRLSQMLKHCIYALLELPDGTLRDLKNLLDRDKPKFRYQVLGRITKASTIEYFSDIYPSFEKTAHIPVLYQLADLTDIDLVANTLCRISNPLNFRRAMDQGKIILCNMSDGGLGAGNARVLGSLILAYCQLATMSREDTPEDERRTWYLYVDEFQKYTGDSNVSFDEMLARSRKYAVPLILAHQNIHQIGPLIDQIFGTTSTLIGFRTSSKDAKSLRGEGLKDNPIPFTDLPRGQTYCKVDTAVFPLTAPLPLKGGLSWKAEKIIRQSQRQDGGRKVSDARGPESNAQTDKPLGQSSASPHVDVDPDEMI